jgi:hypothetical protein
VRVRADHCRRCQVHPRVRSERPVRGGAVLLQVCSSVVGSMHYFFCINSYRGYRFSHQSKCATVNVVRAALFQRLFCARCARCVVFVLLFYFRHANLSAPILCVCMCACVCVCTALPAVLLQVCKAAAGCTQL